MFPKVARRTTSAERSLHPWPQRKRVGQRPAGNLLPRDIEHHVAVAAHALGVEGRQHETPVSHVLGLVEQHHRARTEEWAEQRVSNACARTDEVRGEREHLANVSRIGEKDPRPTGTDAQGEGVAIRAARALHEGQRSLRPFQRLLMGRHPRARRQRRAVRARVGCPSHDGEGGEGGTAASMISSSISHVALTISSQSSLLNPGGRLTYTPWLR